MQTNFTKEMKDLRTENYKTLMKVIEEDTNKWKDIPYLWIGRISLKCPYYPNLQIQCNPYQITKGIFHRHRTNSPKICMESQKILNSLSTLAKENKAGGIMLSDFSLYYEVVKSKQYDIGIKRSMSQNRQPRNRPTHNMGSQFTIKKAQIQSRERPVSSKIVLGKLDSHMQKSKTGPLSYIIHKNQLN